jgi:superfamily II DNA or RNA helicase
MKTDEYILPELDGGHSIEGMNALSADLWISKEELGNVELFLRTTKLTTVNNRTGEEEHLQLAREKLFHVVVPRHFAGIRAQLRLPIKSFIPTDYDEVTYNDLINLRPGQLESWEHLNARKYGILNLGCGKGKTVLALKKIAACAGPAVVVVNNQGLISQWIERIEEHLGLAREDIGIVQGKKAQWDKPIVLVMIQTLANRYATIPIEVRQRFKIALFDEVHHLSAATFLRTANIFFASRYGLTATAEREDGLEGAYYAHLGPIFFTDLTGDLDASVYFQKLDTEFGRSPDIYDVSGELSVGKMYRELAKLPSRNHAIMQMVYKALKSGRKILALTHSAEHPEILKELFDSGSYTNLFTAGAISGKTDGDKRISTILDCDVTFATFGVAREGLDAKTLDTVLFLTPFKAWGGFQQGKGRVERASPGKKKPIAIVLVDHKIHVARALCASLAKRIKLNGIKVRNV